METKELRVGNWVRINNDLLPETSKMVLSVTGMSERHEYEFPDSEMVINLRHIQSVRTYSQFNQFIHPIPLTEKWLLRAVFIADDIDGFTVYLKSVFLVENIYGKWMLRKAISETESIVLCEIPFIHSIQNAWHALTGEELQFKDI